MRKYSTIACGVAVIGHSDQILRNCYQANPSSTIWFVTLSRAFAGSKAAGVCMVRTHNRVRIGRFKA
jgi:hypothetical protein